MNAEPRRRDLDRARRGRARRARGVARDGQRGIAGVACIGALFHAHRRAPDIADEIVLTLRLPRALAGFASGALLAMAGALLQVLLRNPLAEPYVLGVSGGAATFALAAMLASLPWWGVDLAACAGAFASILLVLGLARRDLWRGEPQDASPRLLLTGVGDRGGLGRVDHADSQRSRPRTGCAA